MSEKIINVKGLEHDKREKLIFSTIDSVDEGDSFKLIVEFNPTPLIYMLQSTNNFEINYEKEGPDEWIIDVKKISSGNKKEKLKNILNELKAKDVSDDVKEKAKKLFEGVDATTIGILEQELIMEGVSSKEIRENLCDIHLEVMKDNLVEKNIKVESPHPIHTLMEEHKLIVAELDKLAKLVKEIKSMNDYEEFGENNLNVLKEIAHLLVEAENHHKREEDVLFPRLRKHGIVEPPNIMEMDHKEFIRRKRKMFQMTEKSDEVSFDEFKKEIIEDGSYLSKELKSHIFKEDNILYQMALQALSDKEWDEVKKENDKIGYCRFKALA